MRFDPLNDGISSVQLIDHMGSDLTVVNAARVSMAKESDWEYDTHWGLNGLEEYTEFKDRPHLSKRDCGLISYLAKHKHWTPFSHPQIQLRIKMPIFVARQWFKHMIGFTRNEVSRRYVDDTPEFYCPRSWRGRAENVKQGSTDEDVLWSHCMVLSGGFVADLGTNAEAYSEMMRHSLEFYECLLAQGVCPEQARMVLPQSMYTEFVETGSLAAYARLAGLRLDPHAQKEVRHYAEAIDKIMAELFPISWAALRGNE